MNRDEKKAINNARAIYYGLFGSLFAFVEDENRFKGVKETIELLLKNPFDENSKKALSNMLSIISSVSLETIAREYDGIFYDLSSDTVPTTASFYEEERDDGRKRALMVDYVLQSKYRRDEKKFSDLEDDIGFILSFMQKLIQDEVEGDEKSSFLEREVFRNVLNGFVDEFIENVYMHEYATFYQEVAILLKVFVEFERVYLNIAKPKERIKSTKKKEVFISDAEAKRRLENKRKKSQDIVDCVLEEGGDVEDKV